MSSDTIECPRCSFVNPPEARFCGECGEVMPSREGGPRPSQVAAEPTTLREPARDSPEELGKLELQREMAAADAVRFSGLGRLVAAFARETAKSGRAQGIVNLASARATLRARSEPANGRIRAPLHDVIARAEAVAASAKRDGLRVGQLAQEIDARAMPSAAAVKEIASSLEKALDANAGDFSLEETLEKLGAIAASAHTRGTSRRACSTELGAELDLVTGAGEEAGP